MLWCRRFERLLAAWATGALVAAAVDEASVEAEGDASGLTLHGDWWFNSLRGVPHRYAESAGPIALQPGEAAATRDAGFVALPDAEFILIMACSSWWIHCRRAISEFDRLAEGLRAAGLWKELVAMSLDCSHSANRDICSLVLGDARLAAPVWLDGADAPKIGRLARAFIADLWLADSMPFFYLGSRKEMLYDTRDPDEALNSPDAPRHAIASGHAPSTAEDMLQWLRSTKVEAAAEFTLDHVYLLSRRMFRASMMHLRHQGANAQFSELGCRCEERWRHCDEQPWNKFGFGQVSCRMYHRCPTHLGFCKTAELCGPDNAKYDKCKEPASSTRSVVSFSELHALEVEEETGNYSKASGQSGKLPRIRYADEIDAQGALAVWLHDIFERQPFELPKDDPGQTRRNAIVDFISLLCSYFPDHLEGKLKAKPLVDGFFAESNSECRQSLCRLGGLLANEETWDKYTEVVNVSFQQAPPTSGVGDMTIRVPPAPPLLRSVTQVRRVLWHQLERDWQLCGRPWRDFSLDGFAECEAQDPAARGAPCGIWTLLHALTVEEALLHDCRYAPVENVDNCVGPPSNTTQTDLYQLEIQRKQERKAEAESIIQKRMHNATLKSGFQLREMEDKEAKQCLRVRGKFQPIDTDTAKNSTVTIFLHEYDYEASMVFGQLQQSEGGDRVPVKFQLRSDEAIVDRVFDGPMEQQVKESWRLVEVGHSRVNTSYDWRMMLQTCPPGRALILEGPRHCDTGSNDKFFCDQPCSNFTFVPDKDQKISWAPIGVIKEHSTKQCLGHLYSKILGVWSVQSGFGLQDCAQAQKYRLSVHRLKRHDTLCRVEDDSHCYMVQSDLRFSNLPWVPIEVPPHPPVPAATESSRIVVQRIRRAIDLFFPCAVCRERFLAADLEHVKWLTQPRDSVLWLWRMHNAINARLQTAGDYVPQFPPDVGIDPKKNQWPSRALCPRCYRQQSGQSDDQMDEEQVYYFLMRFYASKASRDVKHSGVPAEISAASATTPKPEEASSTRGDSDFFSDQSVESFLHAEPVAADSLKQAWLSTSSKSHASDVHLGETFFESIFPGASSLQLFAFVALLVTAAAMVAVMLPSTSPSPRNSAAVPMVGGYSLVPTSDQSTRGLADLT